MARKTKDRIIADWLIQSKEELGEETFQKCTTILLKHFPEAFVSKKPGRHKASNNPDDLIEDFFMNTTGDYSGLYDLFEKWGRDPKILAKKAYCLLKLGFLNGKKDKHGRHIFSDTTTAIYNLIENYAKEKPCSKVSFNKEITKLFDSKDPNLDSELESVMNELKEELSVLNNNYQEFFCDFSPDFNYYSEEEIPNFKRDCWIMGIDWYDEMRK